MEQPPKVAIYISGGNYQGFRTNVKGLDIEIVDEDNDPESASDRWDVVQMELPFGG